MKNLELFFFGIYPYIALAVCVIGCWVRYDREPYTWRADSSQLMSKKNTRLANNLFHVGVLGIIGGHFVGLLTPEWLYHHFISSSAKQLLAMVAGGIFGLMCLADGRRDFRFDVFSRTSHVGSSSFDQRPGEHTVVFW